MQKVLFPEPLFPKTFGGIAPLKQQSNPTFFEIAEGQWSRRGSRSLHYPLACVIIFLPLKKLRNGGALHRRFAIKLFGIGCGKEPFLNAMFPLWVDNWTFVLLVVFLMLVDFIPFCRRKSNTFLLLFFRMSYMNIVIIFSLLM